MSPEALNALRDGLGTRGWRGQLRVPYEEQTIMLTFDGGTLTEITLRAELDQHHRTSTLVDLSFVGGRISYEPVVPISDAQ